MAVAVEVPEDPTSPGFDVLVGQIGTRTHYIHNAMAAMTKPLTPSEIGSRAEVLARAGGYEAKDTTFSGQVTRSHLVSMRDKPGRGFAEEVGNGRWQLTTRAYSLIHSARRASSGTNAPVTSTDTPLPEEVQDIAGLVEGAVRTIIVNAYERDPEARRRCIAAHGASCSVCGMSFGAVYGLVAVGYIHVHHLRPLSEAGGVHAVDPVVDLRPVCPNCHAVLHRRAPIFSIEELRELLRRQSPA
jgi:predicted HNH restriction endonuclease